MLTMPAMARPSIHAKALRTSWSTFGRIGLIALGITFAHAPLIQAQQTPTDPQTGQAPLPKGQQLPPIIVQPAPSKPARKVKGPAAQASPTPASTAPASAAVSPTESGSGLPFAAPSQLNIA